MFPGRSHLGEPESVREATHLSRPVFEELAGEDERKSQDTGEEKRPAQNGSG